MPIWRPRRAVAAAIALAAVLPAVVLAPGTPATAADPVSGGTLRVLGFRRRTILVSFIIEGALLAAIGGMLGCLLALPMHGYSTGTMSFNTFSETVFQFRITPWLAAKGIIFAVVVGVIGSLLPAIRAARLQVIAALKSV